jgi:PadR family transcriptional regulator, regulatory protein PadR
MAEASQSRGTFLVLLALQHGAKHGYEIASFVEEKSNGFFRLSFGALYPILHRLEADGSICGDWEAAPAAGPRRKVYGLTAKGRAVARRERARHVELSMAFARLLES